MVEIIDQDTLSKMMAMVLCGVLYDKKKYIVYAVRREKEDANVFVSKIVQNSQGMVMDNDFENGEKEAIEKIIQRILSKESSDLLAKDGIVLFRDFQLGDINYFNIESCYVTTTLVSLIKNCMIYYHLLSEDVLKGIPTVEVVESKKKFNEGFVSNILLILLGVVLIILCIDVLWEFFVKG